MARYRERTLAGSYDPAINQPIRPQPILPLDHDVPGCRIGNLGVLESIIAAGFLGLAVIAVTVLCIVAFG